MVTYDFRPEVEMRPFCACAAKKCNIALIFLIVAKSLKFLRHKENWGRERRWECQILDRKWKYSHTVRA